MWKNIDKSTFAYLLTPLKTWVSLGIKLNPLKTWVSLGTKLNSSLIRLIRVGNPSNTKIWVGLRMSTQLVYTPIMKSLN